MKIAPVLALSALAMAVGVPGAVYRYDDGFLLDESEPVHIRGRVGRRPKFPKRHMGKSKTAAKRKAQHKARMKGRKA